MPMHPPHLMPGAANPSPMSSSMSSSMYAPNRGSYSEQSGLYQPMQYQDHSPQHGIHYTTVPAPVGVVDQSYAQAQQSTIFPTPPMQQATRPESPPDVYNQDQYGQHDLSELLGTLKLNDAGTGEFLDSQANLRPIELLLTPTKRRI